MQLREAKDGRLHKETLKTIFNLGMNHLCVSRVAEALPLLKVAYRGWKQPADPAIPLPPLRSLVEGYQNGSHAEVRLHRRRFGATIRIADDKDCRR